MTCGTKINIGLDKPTCQPKTSVNNALIMFLRKDGVLFDEAGNLEFVKWRKTSCN